MCLKFQVSEEYLPLFTKDLRYSVAAVSDVKCYPSLSFSDIFKEYIGAFVEIFHTSHQYFYSFAQCNNGASIYNNVYPHTNDPELLTDNNTFMLVLESKPKATFRTYINHNNGYL
jgi:hypothetical protein